MEYAVAQSFVVVQRVVAVLRVIVSIEVEGWQARLKKPQISFKKRTLFYHKEGFLFITTL